MTSREDPQSSSILSLLRGQAKKGFPSSLAGMDPKIGKAAGSLPVGFLAALLPYWQKQSPTRFYQERDRLRSLLTHLRSPLAYYDSNLLLFGTGFVEGRFSFDRWGRLQVPWKRRMPS